MPIVIYMLYITIGINTGGHTHNIAYLKICTYRRESSASSIVAGQQFRGLIWRMYLRVVLWLVWAMNLAGVLPLLPSDVLLAMCYPVVAAYQY